MAEIFDELDALADALDFRGVERTALAALPGREADELADLWRYIAWGRFEQGLYRSAIEAAQQARDPLFEAKARFHLWQLEEAREILARFRSVDIPEDAAEAEWYRGVLAEFAGESGDAHFRRAARLAPHLFAEPVRLGDAQIDEVVREALRSLPPPVARALEDAVIEVVDLPRPHADVDPLSLGLYLGLDHLSRSLEHGVIVPARIQIYRRNIERVARHRDEVVGELRTTLLHEVGHHLGFDEEGLERIDLA